LPFETNRAAVQSDTIKVPEMRIIRFSDLTETPWKNGGGITREIAKAQKNGG
tara:strand:- start:26 stop:181 length:156 start_codon:yes stop_codon:yes gene_type:complete